MSSAGANFAACILLLFGHSLLCEGGLAHEKKYYPEAPPVTTLELENGDIVDCVDIYQQPALRHPDMRDHKIMLRSSTTPKGVIGKSHNASAAFHLHQQQLWRKSGKCPQGTVPFLKATKHGPLNHSAVDAFYQSRSKIYRTMFNLNDTRSLQDDHTKHEYAQASLLVKNYGAQGLFNVWNPKVAHWNEMSLAQLWVVKGAEHPVQSLEAGWMVQPMIFGDSLTRLFCFTTNDGYKTNCYNECPGNPSLKFIRTSSDIYFGSALPAVSQYGTTSQVDLPILIYKDLSTGNWYVQISGETAGYWPQSNYPDGIFVSNLVSWGGEIYNQGVDGKHTATEMGSGHFPSEGHTKAAYISNIRFADELLVFQDPPQFHVTINTHANCYYCEDKGIQEFDRRHTLVYGGPGYDPQNCP